MRTQQDGDEFIIIWQDFQVGGWEQGGTSCLEESGHLLELVHAGDLQLNVFRALFGATHTLTVSVHRPAVITLPATHFQLGFRDVVDQHLRQSGGAALDGVPGAEHGVDISTCCAADTLVDQPLKNRYN